MYNDKQQKHNRKKLRKEMTPQEIILWRDIKSKRLGVNFRRQFGIGDYIVDFYCPEKRLTIEIDGSQHFNETHKEYDDQRTTFLDAKNITILRFTNAEINTNMKGVLLKLRSVLNE